MSLAITWILLGAFSDMVLPLWEVICFPVMCWVVGAVRLLLSFLKVVSDGLPFLWPGVTVGVTS